MACDCDAVDECGVADGSRVVPSSGDGVVTGGSAVDAGIEAADADEGVGFAAEAAVACDGAEQAGWGLHEYVLSNVAVPERLRPARIAVMCVGNRLMLDDGIGPAVFDELNARFDIPTNVELMDLGCLTLAMIDRVREFDVIMTVDAVDDSGQPAGSVLRYEPEAMARHVGITASLHDLKLVDLFDSAALLGYHAEGLCLGMQVENASPAVITEGLTKPVHDALLLLVDVVAGELARLGSPLTERSE